MRAAILDRAQTFCRRFDLRVPILMAPMAGACPASLAIAVAKAGGMGAAGALLWSPDEIAAWAHEVSEPSQRRPRDRLVMSGIIDDQDLGARLDQRHLAG